MLTIIAKLLKLLNSNVSPSQLALAVCFAAALGLTPLSSPHNILLVFLLLLLRINLSLFLLSWGFFTLIAYAFDPVSHSIGLALLQADALQGLWQSLYNNNFWRFLGFNNTLILGSTVVSLILAIPLFFISRLLIIKYRSHLFKWVSQSRLGLWVKGGKIFNTYQAFNG
ncbi:TIGR03546 family protein [Dasania sp. GY-MA-18]|uniref:TIGR03546 family protein n=1 Tax=Dasania phycosphaerae TaxID=2950436 RepID=A0A9J6RKP6_9GAMM|nr:MULTISPECIES: TIGR03546 family protein [Dasania]MCR8922477.1 TIGR03546 family protein [Dasania sp. GY-MA-18]MCZ0864905.1 TIGR03546 family protein [Dasania phycosphaerae]MCZ0868633.1 TIGR03546 family protein [Dasania phycosphaerae]